MEVPMTFAQWLKRKRREQGLTQRVLNDRAGLGKNYVTALEGGSVALPTAATRQALHAVLGTSDGELIELGLLEIDAYTGEERAPSGTNRPPAVSGQQPARQDAGEDSDIRRELIDKLSRVRLTADRVGVLRGTLDSMLAHDRQADAPHTQSEVA